MRTLPFRCSDDDIRKVVVEWWELLAAGKYRDAFEMFPRDTEYFDMEWSPELLEKEIATYGCFSPYPGDPKWEPGSIFAQPDPGAIIAGIKIDRGNSYGLDPAQYNGMVHFDDVPLKQKVSTMTARFQIKRVGPDRLTLEHVDTHVM